MNYIERRIFSLRLCIKYMVMSVLLFISIISQLQSDSSIKTVKDIGEIYLLVHISYATGLHSLHNSFNLTALILQNCPFKTCIRGLSLYHHSTYNLFHMFSTYHLDNLPKNDLPILLLVSLLSLPICRKSWGMIAGSELSSSKHFKGKVHK